MIVYHHLSSKRDPTIEPLDVREEAQGPPPALLWSIDCGSAAGHLPRYISATSHLEQENISCPILHDANIVFAHIVFDKYISVVCEERVRLVKDELGDA